MTVAMVVGLVVARDPCDLMGSWPAPAIGSSQSGTLKHVLQMQTCIPLSGHHVDACISSH